MRRTPPDRLVVTDPTVAVSMRRRCAACEVSVTRDTSAPWTWSTVAGFSFFAAAAFGFWLHAISATPTATKHRALVGVIIGSPRSSRSPDRGPPHGGRRTGGTAPEPRKG